MNKFGIYIAKFNEKILNNKDYKGIKNSYVIGEVDLEAKRYRDQRAVDDACRFRIKEEARRNNGKNGFKAEIIDWNRSVKDYTFIEIADEKNRVDDRIRNALEWYNFGKPVSGPNKNEFFLFNDEKLKATDIAKIIEIVWTKGPVDCARNDSWSFYDFQKEIIKQGKEKLETFGELLLYLFCRVGKSAISLQIAKEITSTNHILILTAFPNAKDSFKKYTVNHTEMLGYDFFDKDNLSEEALMKSKKCVVFLSTNALRVKADLEDEKSNSDEAEDEKTIYERINLLRKVGQFDVLIVDETHNGISSPATKRLISKAKEALEAKYVIHNSATPFNDFKSNRFSREQTIQVDFLTILQNNWVNFPKLNIVSLPYYEDEGLTVKTLKNTKGKHKLLFWSAATKSCKDFVTKYRSYFESNGIKIEYVDNLQGTTVEDKINTFQAENNKTIIVSCDKGHTGCTYPKCDCVILTRDLSSAERLIQVMSRCLTSTDGKEEVYFYTIGTENKYKAVSELKRNNNAANNHQTTEAFEDALKTGKLSIRSTSFKEGEDLEEYEAPLEEVLQEVAEFSASLDSIEKDINVDVANVTIEDVVNFSAYTESGVSKAARSLLTLFKEQGKRKVKEVQSKDAEELCEQLKKRINEKSSKKDKGKVEEYTLEELLATWFMNVLRSLNTWLLCQEIEKFEDIVEYVTKENHFSDKERDTFAILVSNNENLLKNFITAHNEVFVKFEDKTLYEKSNMNLRKFLSKDFDIRIEEVGGGYPEELAKSIVRMASIDWSKEDLKVAVLDDIYLEATKVIIGTYNVNEMSLYYICSNCKVGKLLRKAYAIPLEHILYMDLDKGGLYYIDVNGTSHYITNNMSFDLIIANPPYGNDNKGTLPREIIKAAKKLAKESIWLLPTTYFQYDNLFKEISDFKRFPKVESQNLFEGVSCPPLSIVRFDGKAHDLFNSAFDYSLPRTPLINAFKRYNELHPNCCDIHSVILRHSNLKIKDGKSPSAFDPETFKLYDQGFYERTLVFGMYWIENGVHSDEGDAIDNFWNYKLDKYEDFQAKVKELNAKPDLHAATFRSKIEKQNCEKYRHGRLYSRLLSEFDSGNSINYIRLCIPNLDWSHPWTDKEILKEIGLPEDFLKEKENEENKR